jgi:hypothetical protein
LDLKFVLQTIPYHNETWITTVGVQCAVV